MKHLFIFLTITTLLLITGCNNNDNENSNELNIIEIGSYKFVFPIEFELIEGQGIDSYVGNVVGSGISILFDYGWYTTPATNEYEVIENNINGHYRQIVRPYNSELNYTRLHMYKVSDSLESPYGYNSLTMLTNNLNLTEQELVISIFNSGVPID